MSCNVVDSLTVSFKKAVIFIDLLRPLMLIGLLLPEIKAFVPVDSVVSSSLRGGLSYKSGVEQPHAPELQYIGVRLE